MHAGNVLHLLVEVLNKTVMMTSMWSIIKVKGGRSHDDGVRSVWLTIVLSTSYLVDHLLGETQNSFYLKAAILDIWDTYVKKVIDQFTDIFPKTFWPSTLIMVHITF